MVQTPRQMNHPEDKQTLQNQANPGRTAIRIPERKMHAGPNAHHGALNTNTEEEAIKCQNDKLEVFKANK